jgi:hypothetical protein
MPYAMTIDMLNYYRVQCDGLDEKTGNQCKTYINLGARDYGHLAEQLAYHKWAMVSPWSDGNYALMGNYPTWCPEHKEGR